MKEKNNFDVAIIGAGPAGMSCAIYLLRAGISCVLFEGETPGGTLNKISKIENYPGYTDLSGSTLAFKMYSQVEALSVLIKNEKVINIKNADSKLNIITIGGSYDASYVVIATGRVPRRLEIKGSDKYEGRGISYCTLCDGALYKNKNVAIIGGGNSAMASAKYLSDIASKVYIINRSDTLRATKTEQDIVKSKENIDILYNKKIESFIDDNGILKGIKLNDETKLEVDGIFVCIGQELNNFFYEELKIKSDKLGILTDNKMKTSSPNVYAVGDSVSKDVYQVVTAVSEGAIAASDIIRKIKSK